MKVRFDYFKTSGKWYSQGEYDFNCEEWEIARAARNLLKTGIRPGLVNSADNEFFVLVTPTDGHEIPHLIFPTWLERVRGVFAWVQI